MPPVVSQEEGGGGGGGVSLSLSLYGAAGAMRFPCTESPLFSLLSLSLERQGDIRLVSIPALLQSSGADNDTTSSEKTLVWEQILSA